MRAELTKEATERIIRFTKDGVIRWKKARWSQRQTADRLGLVIDRSSSDWGYHYSLWVDGVRVSCEGYVSDIYNAIEEKTAEPLKTAQAGACMRVSEQLEAMEKAILEMGIRGQYDTLG